MRNSPHDMKHLLSLPRRNNGSVDWDKHQKQWREYLDKLSYSQLTATTPAEDIDWESVDWEKFKEMYG